MTGQTPDFDNELQARAIGILLGHAETTAEINALIRIGQRAGFLWRCPTCRADRYADRETCCDKPRPQATDA
jgi:hypothetical protein